jgi:hypothetical protein
MNTLDTETSRELVRWFRTRLDQRNIRFDAEPFSYESNTAYDQAFYRLQAEARAAWLIRYGYEPTPGQLTQAFYDAEFERFRAARLGRRNPLARMIGRLFRKII